jgi:TonB family protein
VLDEGAGAAGSDLARTAELQHYRALCLIALGRTAEAEQAIALSVNADPFTVPDTSELAPRVASVFTAARGRLLPDVARKVMAEGRLLMQKADAAGALRRFEAVTKLLSEPAFSARADLSDLILAANALAELTRTQIAAAAARPAASPEPAAAPAPTTPANAGAANAGANANGRGQTPASGAGRGATPAVLRPPARSAAPTAAPAASTAAAGAVAAPTVEGFEPAVPISQAVPRWQPENSVVARLTYEGSVRLTIDATGRVTGAVMERPTYPQYDRLVLAAAREWTYKPAMLKGQAVASERVVEILLRPRGAN